MDEETGMLFMARTQLAINIAKKRDRLADYLEGTCMSLETAVEYLEFDPNIDWEDEMLTANMETCLGCGWWMESSELIHEDNENTGYCEDCVS